MSSTATSGAAVVSPAERVEVLFEELAELAGQRNAIDGRIVRSWLSWIATGCGV